MDEENRVGTFNGAVSLGEASNFFCVGVSPDGAIATLAQFAVLSNFSGVGINCVAEIRVMQASRLCGERRLGCSCIVEEERASASGDVREGLGARAMWMDSGDTGEQFFGMHRFGWAGSGGGSALTSNAAALLATGTRAVVECGAGAGCGKGSKCNSFAPLLRCGRHPQSWMGRLGDGGRRYETVRGAQGVVECPPSELELGARRRVR